MSEFTKFGLSYDLRKRSSIYNFVAEERISGVISGPNVPDRHFHVVIPDGESRNEVIIDKCVDHFKKALKEYLLVDPEESVEL